MAQKLLIDGTLYHLWYFPAVLLGVVIARGLARLGLPAALEAALLLYLIGLGGDSYYGLTAQLPALDALYGGLFRLCSYTRNGLFLAPFSCFWGRRESGWAGDLRPGHPSLPGRYVPGGVLAPRPGLAPATTACIFSSPLTMLFLFSPAAKWRPGAGPHRPQAVPADLPPPPPGASCWCGALQS